MQTSGSILYATANRLQINLGTATENSKLRVYKETVEAMINMLYDTSLYIIKKSAVAMLEADIKDMLAGLRRVNRDGIKQIQTYLGDAQVNAAFAFTMFDTKEEKESKMRLKNRYNALLECRNNLEDALDFLEPLVY